VYVLTHHAREPVEMKGGTTFYFVTEGIEAAMEKAQEAADGKEIRIGGGVSTLRQYLQAGLIDEMHLAFSPIFLGSGEHLFSDLDLPTLGFTPVENTYGEKATHILLTKEKHEKN
jgi:dihydrofolate reductase